MKNVDWASLQADLQCCELHTNPTNTADGFAEQLDTVVTRLLDFHCPLYRNEGGSRRPVETTDGCRLTPSPRNVNGVDWRGSGNPLATWTITLHIGNRVGEPTR